MATRTDPTTQVQSPVTRRRAHRRPRLRKYLRVLLPQWHRVLLYGLGYLYFLRFSLALWFFAPTLCLVNANMDQSLTSGILVSEFWPQYLCVGFCLVTAGLAALVMMRIALINGKERWNQKAPQLLRALFANDCGRFENWAVFLSQVPNLFVFWYLWHFGTSQGVAATSILGGLLAGAAMALGAWWLANGWYYLHFRVPEPYMALTTFILGRNAARTILLPRWCFHLNQPGADCPGRPSIEQAITVEDREWTKRRNRLLGIERLNNFLVNRPGYGSPTKRGPVLYEAQHFALIAMTLLLYVYLLVWPLTAPIPRPTAATTALFLFIFFGAYPMFVLFATARPNDPARKGRFLAVKIEVAVALAIIFLVIWLLYRNTSVERFPILATVLIMVTTLAWFFAGLAFFFDRYRIPVLMVFVVVLVGPRLMHWDRAFWSPLRAGQEEHYISVTSAHDTSPLPTPGDILASRISKDDKPLIIVTATGGGLHASAWTAAVLAHLERQFGPDFHKHLLLMSTVSGGSTGLLTYLRELHEGMLDTNPQLALDRMQSAAQCSSLEGVGWGLIYYDLPKAVLPLFPYFVPPSPGDQDLDTTAGHHGPFFKDRTWTLRKSFDRNLHNKYCAMLWESDQKTKAQWDSAEDAQKSPAEGLTLRDFINTDVYPAIAMNTTVVESGERFLLANYHIPEINLDQGPNYRSRSFLQTYPTALADGQKSLTDLPLASAAQLSATFPMVSSSARVPLSLDGAVNGMHFADGGYYDNDGTASALEFLRYALSVPPHPAIENVTPKPAENAQQPTAQAAPIERPVRVLLIEIRNSGGINGSWPEASPFHNGDKTPPWNLFNQGIAPLLGFWQAGHESVTARDQSALELLEHAYGPRLEVQSIVFADLWSQENTGTDPLNWSLTPRQRKEVLCSASRPDMRSLYQVARAWFYAPDGAWKSAAPTPPALTTPGALPDPSPGNCAGY
ncbi:hypothetical protein DYQ86_23000 [Acidobacteria bacterium AB60]|nr:hypothetical protein DYQ86_23000 [Acidobacteria bacterium AB60]